MSWGDWLQWLGLLSVLMFVGSIVFLPWLVGRLPKVYFLRLYRRQLVVERKKRSLFYRFVICLLRNGLGLMLLATGVAMLVLPGQGLLTIIIALVLLDLPGKERMLERAVRIKRVRQGLNWLRRKVGKEKFVFDEDLFEENFFDEKIVDDDGTGEKETTGSRARE